MAERVKLQLTLIVNYELNGETEKRMRDYLDTLVKYAFDHGFITGASAAVVDGYEHRIHRIPLRTFSHKEVR